MFHRYLELFSVRRIMSNPLGIKNSSWFASFLALQASSPTLPYSHLLLSCTLSSNLPDIIVDPWVRCFLFFISQCLCTCSFCLDCLPTFFWALIGELFSILSDDSNFTVWVNPSLTYHPLLFVLSFAHTCIRVLFSLHYKYLFIHLSLQPVSFLNVGTMVDPSSLHTPSTLSTTHIVGIQECCLNE